MKQILTLIMSLLMVVISGCGLAQNTRSDLHNINSYKEIPGITKEEIAAIETLKKEKGSFTYGNLLGTEAFKLPDGTHAGFSVDLVNLLSDLFGITFIHMYYDNHETIKTDINHQMLDFSCVSLQVDSQRNIYYMTTPISVHRLKIHTLAGSKPLVSESDIEGFKIGFLEDTTPADFIKSNYPDLSFEVVEAADYHNAVEMLKEKTIDAFVLTEEESSQNQSYDFIISKDFFALAYYPVSISTTNPELEPIISAINKYLASGGSDKLFEIYTKGKYDYKKHQLFESLTAEEKAYLENLSLRKAKIDIGIQHDAYPVSFYNERDNQFEGVVIDVLAEVSKLTDIEFATITTTTDTTLAEILAKLKSGKISMMTQLLYTDSRKDDFLWSAIPYHTTNYALLSKSELANLENYQVYYKKVGTINKSAHEEMFNRWFPNHGNTIVYNTTSEGFDALEKGEIDLLMLCENMLLTLTNYREKPGFKVNVSFNERLDSLLGFSKNEYILRSIVDKALAYVDLNKISDEWLTKNFDYSQKIAKLQATYLFIFSSIAVVLLIAMFFLFLKNKRLGNNLLERTSKLSAVYASIPDTVFTKDTNGVYTSCNPSFEKQVGLPEAEIIGKTDAQIFKERVGETDKTYGEIDEKVLRERSMEIVEENVISADGSHRLIETLRAPLIQNGNVVGLLSIGRDVTERKEMEMQLQQTITAAQDNFVLFEYIINTAQIAFVMSVDNIITNVNEYSISHIGMNVGENIYSYYKDPAQRDSIIEALEHDNMISSIIIKFVIATGETHRFLASAASFQYEQKKAVIVWAIDIEGDELKNDQIRTMQESLQTVLDTLPVPVRIFDLETAEIVYVNNSFLEFLEYDSKEELCGLKIRNMLPDIQSDGASSHELENRIRNSVTVNPVSIELEYRSKTGKIIEALVVTRLIDYKGRPSCIGIIKDLTEEKERSQILLNAAEREREANQSKSRFLANMSHEIRTPMNAIIGMSELLLNEPLTEKQNGFVKDINISSHSLLSIINDILDFSKIEAGKLELSPVDYDFQMFTDNICSMFEFVTRKKGLEFRFETDGDMPKCLYGDDVRLRQVLTNICGNAVKFTTRGFIKLKITATDTMLMFEVEDTGLGIRKEDLPKLFDAFVQADMKKTRNITGTGLGLSISKAFVEMMNGTISVESVYEQGTIFTVAIPKVIGDESAITGQDNRDKFKPIIAPTAKILVVDDNELNLKVASGLLNMYKINADIALSGKEAIDLVLKKDYDIVFMDHMMPEMDGIETTRKIRNLGEKYQQMTIVALTANAVRGAREMFLANGFNSFISKPIDIHELSGILREWLPREKFEVKGEDDLPEKTSEQGEHFLDSLKEANVLNIDIGLSRVSGNEDMYRETLEIFIKKLLPECEKMAAFLDNKDLHNIAISVHGMKSSLSTVGAMELSETAFMLETASKNQDLSYCEEHFPAFLEKLRSLHGQLSAFMPKSDALAARPEGDTAYLQERVQAALNAADEFDSDLVMDELNKLAEYDFGGQINELLENASTAVKDFDFDLTVDTLNQIITLQTPEM